MWHHPSNRKYITYRNATTGGLSHSHRKSAQKILWRLVQRFQRYDRKQTDTQTHWQTNWSQYSTPLPGRSNKIIIICITQTRTRVSAFGLSNNKMAMVDVDDSSYRRTHSPSRLAWSEGWRPAGAESAFIICTRWTLAMALRHDDSTINIVVVFVIKSLHPCHAPSEWSSTYINVV